MSSEMQVNITATCQLLKEMLYSGNKKDVKARLSAHNWIPWNSKKCIRKSGKAEETKGKMNKWPSNAFPL